MSVDNTGKVVNLPGKCWGCGRGVGCQVVFCARCNGRRKPSGFGRRLRFISAQLSRLDRHKR